MATTAQIQKLRRKAEDFYNKRTGQPLTADEQAFKDDELADIFDDAVAEATDGAATPETLDAKQEAWAMLLARADAMLQVAQDEARRIRWQTGNEIQDPTQVAPNLVRVAEALQKRYHQARERQLKEEIEGVTNRPTGGRMDFNTTTPRHCDRNFNNATVKRNSSPDH